MRKCREHRLTVWIWVNGVNYLVTGGVLKLEIMTDATASSEGCWEKCLNNVFLDIEEKDVHEILSL